MKDRAAPPDRLAELTALHDRARAAAMILAANGDYAGAYHYRARSANFVRQMRRLERAAANTTDN